MKYRERKRIERQIGKLRVGEKDKQTNKQTDRKTLIDIEINITHTHTQTQRERERTCLCRVRGTSRKIEKSIGNREISIYTEDRERDRET